MKALFIVIFNLMMNVPISAQYKTLYDFKVKDIYGEDFDLSQLKGKKVLIVNTASKCGFTPQYAELEELYEKYGGDKFTVIGFPANNFMNQEPGTNEEIVEFCQVNYGVTFPMMEKISVKGKDIHPLYSWLTQKSENGVIDENVKWNFNKFLIDEKGHVVGYEPSSTKPMSDKIVNWIKGEN
jgi:glutathione peroxidase